MGRAGVFTIVAGLWLAAGSASLFAQAEAPEPETARVRATANLRSRAAIDSPALGTVDKDSLVMIVGTYEGWRRVKTDERFGWIAGDLLEAVPMPPAAAARGAGATVACQPESMDDCPDEGCADTPEEVLLHGRKRRQVKGRPVPLAMQDFVDLQKVAGKSIGEGATVFKKNMPELERVLKRGTRNLGEGTTVELFGYLLSADGSGAENVNCNLTGVENVDFHINIADAPNRTPYKSIVVEMIPQDRPAGWTTKKLKTIARKDLPVRVIGQLFYDNKHYVRDRKKRGERKNQSKRHSLWEIHPVTKFLVCPAGGCAPKDREGWVALEEWPG
jgi:hypothetical protein